MKLGKDIWDKSKDGSRKEQRSFLRFAIVATAIFLLLMLLKKDNLFRWVQAGVTIGAQNRQIERYQKDIDRLDERIKLLTRDRDSLETFAREQYQFAEPGEDVYLIP